MCFYGLYKLLPKLVQFWSAKRMQALSGTSYSVFSSPWCLLTSFSPPLYIVICLGFSLLKTDVCLISPPWKHASNLLASTTTISPPFSLLSVSTLRVLFTFAAWSSSPTRCWAACYNSTGIACANFSIDFSSNRPQRLHPFLNLPDLLTAGHQFNCCLCVEIHKSISDPDLSTSIQTENTNWRLLGNVWSPPRWAPHDWSKFLHLFPQTLPIEPFSVTVENSHLPCHFRP